MDIHFAASRFDQCNLTPMGNTKLVPCMKCSLNKVLDLKIKLSKHILYVLKNLSTQSLSLNRLNGFSQSHSESNMLPLYLLQFN